MEKHKIDYCIFDSHQIPESWERMRNAANGVNKQWISIDIDPNKDSEHLDVISCLGAGCKKTNCPLVPNIIAVLVENKIHGLNRSVGVVAKLQLINTNPALKFTNNERETEISFLIQPNITSGFLSNGNNRVSCHTEPLPENEVVKCVNISLLIDIVRDTTLNLEAYQRYKNHHWEKHDSDFLSSFQLYANLIG